MNFVTVSANGLGKDMWTLPMYKIENVLFVSAPLHLICLDPTAD